MGCILSFSSGEVKNPHETDRGKSGQTESNGLCPIKIMVYSELVFILIVLNAHTHTTGFKKTTCCEQCGKTFVENDFLQGSLIRIPHQKIHPELIIVYCDATALFE